MHVDLGAGTGSFAYKLAKANPRTLVLAADANADALREISRKASLKPAKGGVPNLLCARYALEDAVHGELNGFADALSVILPWGSLLAAVVKPEVGEGLSLLRSLLKPGGRFEILFGYSEKTDPGPVKELSLPSLTSARLRELVRLYAEAGLRAQATPVSLDELKAVPSEWAKKLAWSGKERPFVRISGVNA